MRIFFVIALYLSMASHSSSQRASAFVLQGGQWPQPGGISEPITLTYSYNNFLDGGLKNLAGEALSESFLRTASVEAFSLWAGVAPLNFVEVSDIGTKVFTSNSTQYNSFSEDSFGQIRLNHRFINGTDEQNGIPTTKAVAYLLDNPGNLAGDIHFDNGDPWEVIGTPSAPDVLGILTHEIGHALGLGHSSIVDATMFPAAPRRSGPGTGRLHTDDIAGIQAIYGEGIGSVTPMIVPEPSTVCMLVVTVCCLLIGKDRKRTGNL